MAVPVAAEALLRIRRFWAPREQARSCLEVSSDGRSAKEEEALEEAVAFAVIKLLLDTLKMWELIDCISG